MVNIILTRRLLEAFAWTNEKFKLSKFNSTCLVNYTEIKVFQLIGDNPEGALDLRSEIFKQAFHIACLRQEKSNIILLH